MTNKNSNTKRVRRRGIWDHIRLKVCTLYKCVSGLKKVPSYGYILFSTAAQWPKIQQNCNFDTVFPKGLNQHLLSQKEESKRVKIFLASKATSNSMILEWEVLKFYHCYIAIFFLFSDCFLGRYKYTCK